MANPFSNNCAAQDTCDFDCAPSESQARQYMLQGMCAILDAVNSGGGGDTEILLLCDDQGGGVIVPFLRFITVPPGGPPPIVTNTTLDGTTSYVPTGTVTTCTSGGDTEILTLCDDQGGGVVVPFIRYITTPVTGPPGTIVDTTLDGVTPYVVLGTVIECTDESVTEGMVVLGRETLPITDAAALGLAAIPAGAEGATIQIQVTAGATNPIRYYVDGGASPTAADGIMAFDLSTITLGIVREVYGGDPLELSNFEAIGEAGVIADLVATYYRRT